MRVHIKGMPLKKELLSERSQSPYTNILINDELLKHSIQEFKYFLILKYLPDNCQNFLLFADGKYLGDEIPEISRLFKENQIIEFRHVLLGGKGGFGSLLKGQPPNKKRTTNIDSCRDLSGRRIRHVNQERMLQEWQMKRSEEENIIKQYENPEDVTNIKAIMDAQNNVSQAEMTEKYREELNEMTNTITSSVKYLMRKQKREEQKKIEKFEYKLSEHNINEIPIKKIKLDLNTEEEDENLEELEKKLFS
jgi:hypothetical protein